MAENENQSGTASQSLAAIAFQATVEADPLQSTPLPAAPSDSVSWTASEFIAHTKNTKWYLNVGVAGLALALVAYLLTKDTITAAVIIICALTLAVYGSRKPRQLQYQVNVHGVQIGDKWHGFQEFRSFSIIGEGAFSSIIFMPLKRFAPFTTIYYAPQDEEKIINLLSTALPYEERKPDAIDSFMQRIRF